MSNINVLIAGESRMGCQLMATALRRSRYRLTVLDCSVESAGVRAGLKANDINVAVISSRLKDGHDAGFNVTREVRASYPHTDVIMLLDSAEPSAVLKAFQSGARGILSRDDPFEVLCKCIYAVGQGQVWAGSRELRLALDALNQAPLPSPNGAKSIKSSNILTSREEGVVLLVAEGMTNRDISRQLQLSEHTVRNYLFRIFNKLGTSNRLELALYALQRQRSNHQQHD
jgi:two-component system nitrate/nitrite response regulator NarL